VTTQRGLLESVPEACFPMLIAPFALLLAQAQAPAAAPARPVPTGPFVALEVTQGRNDLGTITIALNPEKAPITVKNFLDYVHSGYYDGTVFHRVIPGFMIQGGGFTPDIKEKPAGQPIRNEASNGLRNTRGTVAMARLDAANSATSQFFINLRPNYNLDFGIRGAGYAVFGEVVEGMDVVDHIGTVPTTPRGQYENVPEVAVVIKQAREVQAPASLAPPATAPSAPQPPAEPPKP
jgi:peptidyl-prolyl cis-trans isomerase A (cyclophilin A)